MPKQSILFKNSGLTWGGNLLTTYIPASGGHIETYSGYTFHFFYSDGIFEIDPIFLPLTGVDILIVAGGGAGGRGTYDAQGYKGGAGGGAGGVLYQTGITITLSSNTIVVGKGGNKWEKTYTIQPEYGTYINTNGGNSSFNEIIAIGGGAGGGSILSNVDAPPWPHSPWPEYSVHTGNIGGSGGGRLGNNSNLCPPYGNPTWKNSGTTGQGNAGNDGFWVHLGGGGGAGSNGGIIDCYGNYPRLGYGGTGITNSITFSTIYYGGGGGGCGSYLGSDVVWDDIGIGGLGGGGTSASFNSNAENGINGLGSGGGGGYGMNGTQTYGGNGGSGIVIIRYPNLVY